MPRRLLSGLAVLTALFVAGHGLFMWAASGLVVWSRLVAVIALVVLAPVGFRVPALALAVAAALIVILLAAWDSVAYRRRRARSPREAAA